ncbi:MAG: Gfo/Idh/MocA family oxidoreductase [Armatimonadetes bacterium]|nr:Gfo/Idh/MocA family oxidoreductase [Armatimonadota bacterium]MDW8026838.1 Gfo/Idh/MocA family oxidoreductase [Armatimonadota bacterium]
MLNKFASLAFKSTQNMPFANRKFQRQNCHGDERMERLRGGEKMDLKVAIVGSRGVGKFHAQWYAYEGCEVVAFVASRPETLAENEKALKSVVPNFNGNGYADLRKMFELEKPDVVSICSPHHLHAEHSFVAIDFGVHILCEKPLVWFGQDKLDEAIEQSEKVVNAAKERGLKFAVNTQYVAAVSHLLEIFTKQGLPQKPSKVALTMEAKTRERDKSGVNLWIDLAPHPLSVLLALFPKAELDLTDAVFEEGEDYLVAHFALKNEGEQIPVSIKVRRHSGNLERSVLWEDFKVEFLPFVGDDGVYRIRIKWEGGEQVVEDFMQVSIRKFVRSVLGEGEPLCDGAMGLKQMEWLVGTVRKYLSTRRW